MLLFVVGIAVGFIAGLGLGLSLKMPRGRRSRRSGRVPVVRPIDLPMQAIDAVCPNCGAHHVRHPAQREMRCGPCVAKAFDAILAADAREQAEWTESRDDDRPRLVKLR